MTPSVSVFSGGSRPSDRKGAGADDPDPEIRGGVRSPPQIIFRPFGPQFGLKIGGEGPSSGSATGINGV